jgi:thiol reductant ABC exporter CydC subunit
VSATVRGWWATAARRERLALAGAIVLATVAALAAPALLGLSGYLLARAAEHPEILTLAVAIVGVRFFGLLRASARYAERIVSHDLALGRLGRERVAVFGALIPRVPGRLGGRTSADALDAVVADVDRLADLTVRVLVPAASIALAAVACAVAAALVLPAAGAALGAVLALQAAVLVAIGSRDAGERSQARASASRELVTLLDAAPELVAWGAARTQAERAERAGKRLDRLTASAARIASGAASTSLLAAGAAALATLAVTAPAAADGRIGGVMVAALVLLAFGAAEVVSGAGDVVEARREVRIAGVQLDALTSSPVPASGHARPRDGGVRVRGLQLRRGGRAILDGVDLDVGPGERVALIGPSGAGKSTLADVLAGLADPDGGSVRVGGVELADLDGDALREFVRWIPQDPHVFATTIAANVRIASPGATDAEVEHALRAVGAGPWLDALPAGLESQLGEQGEQCSGGERQRIGLARAYLCAGKLLILDEPASHLPRDEALNALAAVMDVDPARGVLLVTHRREEMALASSSTALLRAD